MNIFYILLYLASITFWTHVYIFHGHSGFQRGVAHEKVNLIEMETAPPVSNNIFSRMVSQSMGTHKQEKAKKFPVAIYKHPNKKCLMTRKPYDNMFVLIKCMQESVFSAVASFLPLAPYVAIFFLSLLPLIFAFNSYQQERKHLQKGKQLINSSVSKLPHTMRWLHTQTGELNCRGDCSRSVCSGGLADILEQAFYLSTANGDDLFDIIEKLDFKNDTFGKSLHTSINQIDDVTVRTSLENAFTKAIECRRYDYNYSKMEDVSFEELISDKGLFEEFLKRSAQYERSRKIKACLVYEG